MSSSTFVQTTLYEKCSIRPKDINKSLRFTIQKLLEDKLEGVCTHHGYILKNSINVLKLSHGEIREFSLNGDVQFNVMFEANVCNPAIGSVVFAKIVKANSLGILAESYLDDNQDSDPIMEIVIIHHSDNVDDVDKTLLGKNVSIQILGKKFELHDKKISVVGKIVPIKPKMTIDNNPNDFENDDEDEVEDEVEGDIDGDEDEELEEGKEEDPELSERDAEEVELDSNSNGTDEFDSDTDDLFDDEKDSVIGSDTEDE